jgi:hypothetical protein
MHRHSDEAVAAVVLHALLGLRTGPDGDPAWTAVPPEVRAVLTERVRQIRAGVLPREQYENMAGPGDPPYNDLPVTRRDEDQLEWLVTQALTGD